LYINLQVPSYFRNRGGRVNAARKKLIRRWEMLLSEMGTLHFPVQLGRRKRGFGE